MQDQAVESHEAEAFDLQVAAEGAIKLFEDLESTIYDAGLKRYVGLFLCLRHLKLSQKNKIQRIRIPPIRYKDSSTSRPIFNLNEAIHTQ
jgi:hypothetical protein